MLDNHPQLVERDIREGLHGFEIGRVQPIGKRHADPPGLHGFEPFGQFGFRNVGLDFEFRAHRNGAVIYLGHANTILGSLKR